MPRFITALISTVTACTSTAFAQPARPAPVFDAVSVKVGGPNIQTLQRMRGGPGTSDPGRFTAIRANLASLMMRAYGIRIDQISGPDWIKDLTDETTLYSVEAVLPPDTSNAQFSLMFQNLLAERFHLAIHREMKEFPGYELLVAEGGPKIKECVLSNASAEEKSNCPSLPMGASMTTSMSRGIGSWGAIRQRFMMSIPDFAENLGPAINEAIGMEANAAMPRVVDKTGLSGTYRFDLEFAGIVLMPGTAPSPGAAGGDPGSGAPTLFNALEKQLGLKLIKTKNVPVDILVIDHADKVPTGN